MASTTPRTWAIKQALQSRLQQILVANDYRTDAGADVRLEKSQLPATDAPRITIFSGTNAGKGRAQRNQREFAMVVEATVPVTLENAAFLTDAIAEDIEDALDEFVAMPGALPLVFEESLYLDCPEGMPVMAVQLMYGTEFRR
jgi:CTP:molybdopterin cytidylyltransferase MocA